MGNAESKLAYKNRLFRLAGVAYSEEEGVDDIKLEIGSQDPYWRMFWEVPTSAEEVFAILTYSDIKEIRDSNKANFLNWIRIVTFKLVSISRSKTFAEDEKSKKELLNCVRVLTRIVPFLFEMGSLWEKDVNNLFWSVGLNAPSDESPFTGTTTSATVGSFSSSESRNVSLESSSVKANIGQRLNASPSSTRANVGQGTATLPLGHTLITTLVDLLFTREFTLERNGVRGSEYKIWEAGIGYNAKYEKTSPQLDSNRLEILRLLLALTSQTLYCTPKNAVSGGSRFMTTLVTTLPRMKALTFICSLLNVVCRSCKTDDQNNGLSYATASNSNYSSTNFFVLRRTFVTYTLQLLTVMLVYPLPPNDLSFLHKLNMLPTDERPHNMVRLYLGRLHKESELTMIYTSIMSLLTRPIEEAVEKETNPFNVIKTNFVTSPTSTAVHGTQNNSFPALSSWSTELVALLWDLIQCNKHFKAFVYSKKAHELMVTLLYYIKYYRHNELWRPSLIRISCFFMLYLTSDGTVTSKLLAPFSTNYYSHKIPNFYKLSNQTVPSNLTYRDFFVIQISNMIVQDEFDIMISPNLYEFLYNIIPVKTPDPTTKGKTYLSYHAGLAVLNVINMMSKPGALKDPLRLDLLALLIRSIAHAICRCHKESRTLLFLIVKHERVLLNLMNSIQSTTLDNEEQEANSSEDPPSMERVVSNRNSPQLDNLDQSEHVTDADEKLKDEEEVDEFQKSLRPNPLIGMSLKAKSKLPVDAPLSTTWAGHRALLIILRSINLVRKEIPRFDDIPKTEIIEVLLKIENINNFEEKVARFATSEFLPKTKFDNLRFTWSSISLGWYESTIWGIIFYENVSSYREATSSSWFNKRSSTISLKGVASSWGFNWKSPSPEKSEPLFELDVTILQLGIWNGTAIKLFKIKKPVVEKPLVDMTSLMKRFRLNSTSSIATAESKTSISSPRLNGQSPNQLTPINSRQSFATPRNSVSHRDSVHLNLSRQSSFQNL
ncbi:Ecm30p CYBJADRAFT_168126 [Cyberlindnera jadinii NRRL Y-1542]|uniref:Uncharacterized protein n=1 Tax=Cyberlindnera jadinii (strain ATCC 18201 / CBS 1600 / BCRC 20928 / JCM 3617 / NBRC 0987 / NRRL Y-1542) TaxID=983966 RepID=A0A1E4S0P6_CYBJN|nr:hypothetical protein CYBJADRAFT_168126 [Cyberlindnera jadinii NRRL Y-1542]ODV73065.1 hypothetical protein CYBJADRAFT_168126 [Cyberlindnera jadinii NRRL Y-1542]